MRFTKLLTGLGVIIGAACGGIIGYDVACDTIVPTLRMSTELASRAGLLISFSGLLSIGAGFGALIIGMVGAAVGLCVDLCVAMAMDAIEGNSSSEQDY